LVKRIGERPRSRTVPYPAAVPALPPGWPTKVLNELAKYVIGAGVVCGPGRRFDLRAPVTGYPHVDGAPDTTDPGRA
jgi:hypothetical protein